MNKLAQWAFIILFLSFSLIPLLGMLLTPEASVFGNEIVVSRVSLTNADGSLNRNFLSDVTDYVAQNFAFRSRLVTLWSKLHAVFLRTSTDADVVLGSDGWLYYAPTLADYTGTAMSDEELLTVAANLLAMQEYAHENGVEFYFTVAPNKNSLYPHYMPADVTGGHENSNIAKLMPLMEEYGINYIDLYSVLSTEAGLYYRTDTHWNAIGAAAAADEICRYMGIEADFSSRGFIEDGGHRGDLYEMLYPAGGGAETAYNIYGGFSFTAMNNANNGDAMRILTENAGQTGSLLCYRDSFGNALYPYLAEVFGNAVFLRASEYDLSQLGDGEYTVILIEIVERNLPQLAQEGIYTGVSE